MRLQLTTEEQAFRDELRTFFTTKVPLEIRDKIRDGHELTKAEIVQAQQILNSAGYAVPGWPKEWGGQDWSALQHHIWIEEMQAACVPHPLVFNSNMVGPVIAAFGNQAQKERFLSITANLDIWWAQGFSEPDAGSDLASLRTTAVKDGDDWIVNGQKTWTTLGQHADWIFCLARTDPDAPKRQQGISFLVFEMSSPGVTIRPIQLIDGGHEVNEVFFDNVRVPGENLIGEENQGWTIAKFLLGNERAGIAPAGAMKRQVAKAKKLAGDRLTEPLLAARIAELENDILALELTSIRVAAHSEGGKPHPASSVLKLRGTQLQQAVTELLFDLAGAESLGTGSPYLADWITLSAPTYLNMRKVSIYGGSNEVQRQIIAGTILGL